MGRGSSVNGVSGADVGGGADVRVVVGGGAGVAVAGIPQDETIAATAISKKKYNTRLIGFCLIL